MDDLRHTILELRNAIRSHRDQRLDDRCWVDDHSVWAKLDGTSELTALPSFNEGMRQCERFYRLRRSEKADPIPADAVTDPARWDDDLAAMTDDRRSEELARLQEAVRRHRDIVDRPRTIEDDRALYAVLPEKLPADFRLPSEDAFLGEAEAPHAGCPSFWRSHAGCPRAHDLHHWGPCE